MMTESTRTGIAGIQVFDTAEQNEGQLLAGENNRFEFKELRLTDRCVPATYRPGAKAEVQVVLRLERDPHRRRPLQVPCAKSMAGGRVAFANAGGSRPGENDAGASLEIPQERLNTVERWFVSLAANNAGGRKATP